MTDILNASCCPVIVTNGDGLEIPMPTQGELDAYVQTDENNRASLFLLVEGMHCGTCIHTIESALKSLPGIEEARANLTTHRLYVKWQPDQVQAIDAVHAVTKTGYRVVPYDPSHFSQGQGQEEKELLKAMAVSGFAAANVMLFSVSVWAGLAADMGPQTRTLFYWISALIAVPAIIYAGRPFFRSAITALKSGHTNMDVPISLGVALATALSISETMRGAEHAYFDSAISLLFFLLIGRYLDRRARSKARSSAEHLLSLNAVAVTVVDDDGNVSVIKPESVTVGMRVLVAPGEKVPVDGTVLVGQSDLDMSLISGETLPESVRDGAKVYAGCVNLTGSLQLRVDAVGQGTLLAEIARLMEEAEQKRARFVDIADRVARYYSPVVHTLAAVTFAGWGFFSDIGWQAAMLYAIAVLIITCPCALGLAVPVVQVVANTRMMRAGILMKSNTAMERLSKADCFVFDKTGTLTIGRPQLLTDSAQGWTKADLERAASAARHSIHPLSQALTRASTLAQSLEYVDEIPGCGLTWRDESGVYHLGSRRWLGIESDLVHDGPEIWFSQPRKDPIAFLFTDPARVDAREVIASLKAKGKRVMILSGDREAVVQKLADGLGVSEWHANKSPAEKASKLEELAKAGLKTCMVGDGLNDAPALASAYVSMSPTTASDISQNAADIVFQGQKLSPVFVSRDISLRANRLVFENIGLAFAYNVFTVPLAMAGFVTPLVAAIAMSTSSIVVIANAMRLSLGKDRV